MRSSELERKRLEIALSALTDRSQSWTRAQWLVSEFESPVWECAFESKSQIDFRVTLEDGLTLTHPKHSKLEQTFKRFLIAQTHLEFTSGVLYADSSLLNRVLPAVHICDYLLMRTKELKLATYGLSALSESAAYQMLRDLAQWECSESVYQWRFVLSAYIRNESAHLTAEALANVLSARPDILNTVDCPDLDMKSDAVGQARAWLWASGFYRMVSTDRGGSRFILDTAKLAPLLYPRGTLLSRWKKRRVRQLELYHGPNLARELDGVPVRGQKRSEAPLRFYVRALNALPLIERRGIDVPACLVRVSNDIAFHQELPLNQIKRYRTLPHDLILKALRNSLEFLLEFSDDLISAYLEIARRCVRDQVNPATAGRNIHEFASRVLLDKGLKCWSVAIAVRKHGVQGPASFGTQVEERFFAGFRSNEGLYELMEVLWGALLVALGALMARRQGELTDLMAGICFDLSGTRLRFAARKRGTLNYRESLMRPIPDVLVNLIRKVEGMQTELVKLGVLNKYTELFAFPKLHSLTMKEASDDNCNDLLDRFCDYFQMPVDQQGHRYYIRHHQLRRFFPQLFLQGNAAGGLDTLRWFLGHTDPEHLWRYITENTPGEVLRESQVDYVLEQLHARAPNAGQLANALERRFGASIVQLVDSDEVADYLESLLVESTIRVEPQFFECHTGREYVVLIIIERPLLWPQTSLLTTGLDRFSR